MIISSLATSVRSLPTALSAVGQVLSPIVQVALPILANIFKFCQIPYFLGIGTKEILYDTKKYPLGSFRQILSYEVAHGLLMLSCGLCEVVAIIHRVGLMTIATTALSIIGTVSSGCFGLASFLMICEQVRILVRLIGLENTEQDEKTKDALFRAKISAVMALVSGLCYLVGVALALFGGPVAILVLFMLTGLCAGGLKILFDWHYSEDAEILSNIM